MTYCVAVKLDAGLVFLSDSRTNAGLDQIGTFRKMMIYEQAGDRFMVMLSAGNLSISQQVREILQVEKLEEGDKPPITIWNATSMFDAARVLGAAMRRVFDQDGAALKKSGLDFNASMIFGGQIKGEAMRLFLVYSAGNFIEATRETCFFQIGESKYGGPSHHRGSNGPPRPGRGGAAPRLGGHAGEVRASGRPAVLLVGHGPAAERADRLHRRSQPVLPDDPRHLGPAAAPGVRVDRRPAVGRRSVGGGAALRAVAALRDDAKDHRPGPKTGLRPTRRL